MMRSNLVTIMTPDITAIQPQYKGILLDLDNTLYAYKPCHRYALEQCHQLFCDIVTPIEFASFETLYTKGREEVKKHNKGTSGSRSRHLYFQRMFEIEYGKTDIKNALKLGSKYWDAYIEKIEIYPWVLPFLKGVQDGGLKVAIVTNQESSLQYRKLICLHIETLINSIVTSEEAGVEKPDPKIFALALDKLGLKPDDVVMLGDDLQEDAVGATQAGIAFFHVAN